MKPGTAILLVAAVGGAFLLSQVMSRPAAAPSDVVAPPRDGGERKAPTRRQAITTGVLGGLAGALQGVVSSGALGGQ